MCPPTTLTNLVNLVDSIVRLTKKINHLNIYIDKVDSTEQQHIDTHIRVFSERKQSSNVIASRRIVYCNIFWWEKKLRFWYIFRVKFIYFFGIACLIEPQRYYRVVERKNEKKTRFSENKNFDCNILSTYMLSGWKIIGSYINWQNLNLVHFNNKFLYNWSMCIVML